MGWTYTKSLIGEKDSSKSPAKSRGPPKKKPAVTKVSVPNPIPPPSSSRSNLNASNSSTTSRHTIPNKVNSTLPAPSFTSTSTAAPVAKVRAPVTNNLPKSSLNMSKPSLVKPAFPKSTVAAIDLTILDDDESSTAPKKPIPTTVKLPQLSTTLPKKMTSKLPETKTTKPVNTVQSIATQPVVAQTASVAESAEAIKPKAEPKPRGRTTTTKAAANTTTKTTATATAAKTTTAKKTTPKTTTTKTTTAKTASAKATTTKTTITKTSATPTTSKSGSTDSAPKKPGRKRAIKDDSEKPAAKIAKVCKNLTILDDSYRLKVVVRGHTNTNIPVRLKDEIEDSKDLWCCEFEPKTQSDQSELVAICGSYTVLFLDTHQGRYTKKYTHAESQEIFYCMSWTTLKGSDLLKGEDAEENESCNLLAVAGRLGSIKLLNPLQNECYRYLFGHRKAVLAMRFSKKEPRWLFTASADNTVRLWDIGSPVSKSDDSVCLAKFSLPPDVGVPCALSISYDLSTLVVGCDNGDVVKFTITKANLTKIYAKIEEAREKELNEGDKWEKGGAIVTIPASYTYDRGDEWHDGYIDDICILGQDGDGNNSLYNHIVSRGSEDMEMIVWDPVKSTKTDAKIISALAWPDSAQCTGLKFKVIETEGQKVLLAGDYDGQICIYNIGNGKKSKTLSDNSKEQFQPTRILSHKMSSELIRDVCCSGDTGTIVAVDNNNTAYIWVAASKAS